eukprot:CAMPEP_0204559002 /NCGR_PEP_ID=MMETSP0661-20131031/31565_1 /ASSEMBLY_ACC=CAM_ASM_000606 /TAXON_ID=109239 /ORGANISM="Alexandrium margalefi, Strain AMGDE01CS-322" /LENGTH=143 /DNA_ID=CAMNT_0051566195 /DNA_START=303 /DNA_END=730 /DNA_ORIENTATION=-
MRDAEVLPVLLEGQLAARHVQDDGHDVTGTARGSVRLRGRRPPYFPPICRTVSEPAFSSQICVNDAVRISGFDSQNHTPIVEATIARTLDLELPLVLAGAGNDVLAADSAPPWRTGSKRGDDVRLREPDKSALSGGVEAVCLV